MDFLIGLIVGGILGTILGLVVPLYLFKSPLNSHSTQPILGNIGVRRPKIRKPVIQTDEKAFEREIQEQGETRG